MMRLLLSIAFLVALTFAGVMVVYVANETIKSLIYLAQPTPKMPPEELSCTTAPGGGCSFERNQ